jgi:peroxiredoxin
MKKLLSVACLSTVFAIGAVAMAQTATSSQDPKGQNETKAKAKVGEKAPEFTLKDAAGKDIKLADYQGKLVVLQWINPKCPVCVGKMKDGSVKKMRDELKQLDKDVVHLMINSTSIEGGGAEATAAYLKEYKVEAPGLIDMDGTVGHLYGAKTTPHMFVIDAQGILRYDGAIDDNAKGDREVVTNYVVNAVKQIKAGETVEPDKTRSYGCSVKYKK